MTTGMKSENKIAYVVFWRNGHIRLFQEPFQEPLSNNIFAADWESVKNAR